MASNWELTVFHLPLLYGPRKSSVMRPQTDQLVTSNDVPERFLAASPCSFGKENPQNTVISVTRTSITDYTPALIPFHLSMEVGSYKGKAWVK